MLRADVQREIGETPLTVTHSSKRRQGPSTMSHVGLITGREGAGLREGAAIIA